MRLSRPLPKRFARDEAGSGSVEACLWMPVLFAFFILVLDGTYLFLRDSEIRRVVQDGSRQYVMGFFGTDTGEMQTWIEERLAPIAPNAVAETTVDAATGVLFTSVRYPASDTDLTGWIGKLTDLTLSAHVVNKLETAS